MLLAMVGPEYEFLYVDVGANGRNSDGGIWDQCRLKRSLEDGSLKLPPPTAENIIRPFSRFAAITQKK